MQFGWVFGMKAFCSSTLIKYMIRRTLAKDCIPFENWKIHPLWAIISLSKLCLNHKIIIVKNDLILILFTLSRISIYNQIFLFLQKSCLGIWEAGNFDYVRLDIKPIQHPPPPRPSCYIFCLASIGLILLWLQHKVSTKAGHQERWSDAMKRLTLHHFNFFASVKRLIASLL